MVKWHVNDREKTEGYSSRSSTILEISIGKKSQFQIVQQFGVKRKKVSRKSKMRNGKTRGNKIGKENGVIGHTQIAKCTFWLLENDV